MTTPDPHVYARLLQRLHNLRMIIPESAPQIDDEIALVVNLATHPVRRPESAHRWLWTLAEQS